jgi:hypothetical protein
MDWTANHNKLQLVKSDKEGATEPKHWEPLSFLPSPFSFPPLSRPDHTKNRERQLVKRVYVGNRWVWRNQVGG